MIKPRCQIRLAGVVMLVFALCIGAATAGSNRRVLILHSHSRDHINGRPQETGAIKALARAGWRQGVNVEIQRHAMNSGPVGGTAKEIARQVRQAVSGIAAFQPDIILAIGDNAFGNIALPLAKTDVDIVFSGLQGQPETYNRFIHFMNSRRRPGFNITGIYEKRHIRQALELLSRVTELKKVRFFQDLSTPGRVIAEQIDLELRPGLALPPLPCRTERVVLPSWEAYCHEINRINTASDISAFYLGARLLQDKTGSIYPAARIIRYAIENAKKPAIGIDYGAMKEGLYGGASVDGFAMGYQAGEKIAAILDGVRAGELPIQDAQSTAIVFNLTRAETLGLQIPSEILLAADEVFHKQ